jgi:hypothetical protein
MYRVIVAATLVALLSGPAVAQQPTMRSQAPEGVVLYFINLRDGMHLYPHFTVRFGLKGMGVAPAGIDKASTGHHHLLIDSEITNFDEPIPNDRNHLHYGAGRKRLAQTVKARHRWRSTITTLAGSGGIDPLSGVPSMRRVITSFRPPWGRVCTV